jgi:hypothetical protein
MSDLSRILSVQPIWIAVFYGIFPPHMVLGVPLLQNGGSRMKRIAVVGVGNSKFGVRDDASMKELAFEAIKEALED